MAFLRFQLTACKVSTNEVVFSGYVATWQLADLLMKGDKKYGLDITWSIVPVHLSVLPNHGNYDVYKL